jgi:hypothetical protein
MRRFKHRSALFVLVRGLAFRLLLLAVGTEIVWSFFRILRVPIGAWF